jgi:hypothetical protein
MNMFVLLISNTAIKCHLNLKILAFSKTYFLEVLRMKKIKSNFQ